ncbi:CD59 glycoprotein-like [Aquarana catesbeiana]|uniref:CD59 glycoprotein-like n=1 Tax=Aquarana catesbeiana TaxID=8400 RepID=UPI003CCA679E
MMKAVITLLILGLLFIHGEALRCYQGCCTGTDGCCLPVQTCAKDEDRCLMRSGIGMSLSKTWFTGGCFTGQECMKYELTDPNIRCCEGDLCNE